jgi:transcriptional regulator with XRE-family HTH domain
MGLSQKQLAARLGVARATVWRWERGVNPIEPLSAKLVEILARGEAARPPSKPPSDTR